MELEEIKSRNGKVMGHKFDIKAINYVNNNIEILSNLAAELKKLGYKTFDISITTGYYDVVDNIEIQCLKNNFNPSGAINP